MSSSQYDMKLLMQAIGFDKTQQQLDKLGRSIDKLEFTEKDIWRQVTFFNLKIK
jgi:hypothetical protein